MKDKKTQGKQNYIKKINWGGRKAYPPPPHLADWQQVYLQQVSGTGMI